MMEMTRSYETSLLTAATLRRIQEDGIQLVINPKACALHQHRSQIKLFCLWQYHQLATELKMHNTSEQIE
jgi:hypothetical protein